ncbi:ABC transporter permease [Aminipila luticellarii]|uniref:ABC transporter permease n=1 Tax=Aminipila luticellarii TaxID=2507160 RepID=A0A410PYK3_9FIRM|nr:ABC transporter permease [Aminipila luticellarii]QAT44052.1 ABC transporter permease [Aminipila luticellarii]
MLKITKRDNLNKNQEMLIRALAICLSIVCSGLILLIFGLNPVNIFQAIIDGSLGTELRIQQTIIKAVPLVITSLGILVAFKMKFWNIGGEGQIVMGALAAAFVALHFGDLPKPLMLLFMMIAAMLAGGFWAFIPAVFKAKMGTNETIFTLMMNYIAIKFVTYLQYGPWMDPNANGFPKIAPFPENAILPSVLGVHAGWILAILCTVLIYFLMKYTKLGYEITVVGESFETARYAGMNINKIIIVAMMISGGLCGLVGMIQASAIEKTLVSGISCGYGFTAIITAWLARLNAVATLFACLAFAMLIQGGAYIQLAMNVPSAVASVVEGTILFFVLGSEFFLQYRVNLAGKTDRRSKKEVA